MVGGRQNRQAQDSPAHRISRVHQGFGNFPLARRLPPRCVRVPKILTKSFPEILTTCR
jgi:hypothetical protein